MADWFERKAAFQETLRKMKENPELASRTLQMQAGTMLYLREYRAVNPTVKSRVPDVSVQKELLLECSALLSEAKMAMAHLEDVTAAASALSKKDMVSCARSFREQVVPAMEELRSPIDKLEFLVDKKLWPYPSYGDMIFQVSR